LPTVQMHAVSVRKTRVLSPPVGARAKDRTCRVEWRFASLLTSLGCVNAGRQPDRGHLRGLPISSGGAHALRRTTRRAAYEAMLSFLRTCTTPLRPVELSFKMHQVPELPPAPDLEQQATTQAASAVRMQVATQNGRHCVALGSSDRLEAALD
jgi:hypothetical protein